MTGLLTAAAPPAGGAELGQVLLVGGAVTVFTIAMVVLGLRHRSGRSDVLDRIAAPLVRLTGLPAWAALPPVVGLVGFCLAGPGFVWDVAIHIDDGRDAGPLANPSHYLLIGGILWFFAAGWLACVMPRERVASGVRITRDWHAPAAGVAMLGAASLSLTGFPADDAWHRLFGQDVTLWGPTHLMMITGGLLNFLASAVLVREGRRAAQITGREHRFSPLPTRHAAAVLLVALTIAYQQEFSYGVPQFSLAFQPVLIAFGAGLTLVWARQAVARWAALQTAVIAAAIMALLAGLVVLAGQSLMHFPLYLAEAVLVELAALALLARRGPTAFAVASGVLVGTVGVAAEAGWSHVWMPQAWPVGFALATMPLAVVAGVSGGLLGSFVARCLRAEPDPVVRRRGAWVLPATALLAALLVLGSLLPTRVPDGRATITLADAGPQGPGRFAHATVRFDPPSLARDADWVQGLAWQGGSPAVSAPLREVAPGVWRTTEPLPRAGTWKSMIRVHRGREMASVPVRLPADAAIPAPAIPAPDRFTRALAGDSALMQRERKDDVPGWLWAAAASAVLAAVLALLGLIGWAMLRVARGGGPPAGAPARPRRALAPRGAVR